MIRYKQDKVVSYNRIKMKKYSIFLLIMFFVFSQIDSLAQSETIIRGKIIDKTSGMAIPGATIVEIDKQNRIIKGTITDVNGNYFFEVSDPGHPIQVSFIGYVSQTFNIDSRSIIDIELEEASLALDEVVIIAQSSAANTMTGVYQRDQTGSVTVVDMLKFNNMPTVSAADALQGQVSGLDIVSASGSPGSGSNIVIRGMGSLGNTNPLIVVDGIPQDINTDNFNFASADEQNLGQLLSLAPQDIKTIEVLKDAASTAIWGSKGANGVLLIETSSGERGKIRFNYQYKINANIQPRSIPMLNGDEYITMQLEQWHNAEGEYNIPREIAFDRNYADFYNYSANTNWLEAITKDSYSHDHFFKLSGGGRRSRYYTSVNYQNNYGNIINTSYQRLSFRVNFDYDISTKLRFTTNFNYNNTFNEESPSTTYRFLNTDQNTENVRKMAFLKAPNMSIWEYDEYGNQTGEYFTPIESYQGNGVRYYNPVAMAELGKNNNIGNEIQNNFIVDYSIFQFLKFRETISFSYSNDKSNKFIPSSAIGADWLNWSNNNATERNRMNVRWLSRSQLFFLPFSSSNDHSMTTVLMWEMEQKSNEYFQLSTSKGPSQKIVDPSNNAPTRELSSGSSLSRLYGAMLSVNYKYLDRYLFSSNLRSDGSSAFGESNKWGLFPSLSIGWRFSKENFFESFDFLHDAKLRLSWGQSGKALNDPYASYAYYHTFDRYMDVPAVIPAQIQLVNLKWETVTSWNTGIDLNLFKGRLNINADLYKRVTTDLLWEKYSIPSTTGYNELKFFNGGAIQNAGWEFFINGTVVDRENFTASLDFNISQNDNSILSFPDNFVTERGTIIDNGVFPIKAEVGKPIGSFYGFRYLGVYASDEDAIARDADGKVMIDSNGDPIPLSYKGTYNFKGGDAIYKDVNHDGVIDIMDAVYIGSSSPRFVGGFGSALKYKSLSASFHFHYRLGFDIVNQVAIDTEGMLDKNNQSKAVLNRWKWQGHQEEGLLPRAYMNHPANNLGSDRYVERGDFLRLNNVNVAYRLPDRVSRRLNVVSMEIGINLRKILTITNYSGQDPEIGRVEINPFWLGRDNARTPVPRIYSLVFTMNF
jgi:TonB-linked SusC/RagA family outer membrane protein